MKRVLLTAAVALLIPSLVGAWTPTVGVYFDGKLTYTPAAPFTIFRADLVITHSPEYYVTGIEYSLVTPDPTKFGIINWEFPPNYVQQLGDPFNGHAITYWPPLTGVPLGYDLLVTYNCMAFAPCHDMWNFPIVVSADPRSGYLRGTYAPYNDKFYPIGLTSYLCPEGIGVEEESWGAIKSMYR
jgi:hypothetical protein